MTCHIYIAQSLAKHSFLWSWILSTHPTSEFSRQGMLCATRTRYSINCQSLIFQIRIRNASITFPSIQQPATARYDQWIHQIQFQVRPSYLTRTVCHFHASTSAVREVFRHSGRHAAGRRNEVRIYDALHNQDKAQMYLCVGTCSRLEISVPVADILRYSPDDPSRAWFSWVEEIVRYLYRMPDSMYIFMENRVYIYVHHSPNL